MIEKLVIEAIKDTTGCWAGLQLPPFDKGQEPGQFAVAKLIASDVKDMMSRATVVVYCYAPTMEGAAEYARQCWQALKGMRGLGSVSAVKLADISASPDRGIKRPMYEVTANFWFYDDDL